MSIFYDRIGLDLTAEADRVRKKRTAGDGGDKTDIMGGGTPTNGGSTGSDYVQPAGAPATSVGVDGDPARSQTTTSFQPAYAMAGPTAPDIIPETLAPPVAPPVAVQPTYTQPTGTPGNANDVIPLLPGGYNADNPYSNEGRREAEPGRWVPNTPLGGQDAPEGGAIPAAGTAGPGGTTLEAPPSTPTVGPGVGPGPAVQPPAPETPTAPPPDTGTEGSLEPGEPIAGLSQFADWLVNRLNSPDPYGDEEVQRILASESSRRGEERRKAVGDLSVDAGRRGVFYGSPLTSGIGEVDTELQRQADVFTNALTERRVNAREARSSDTAQKALQFMGLAGDEKRAKNQLAIAAATLAQNGGLDPNSLLAMLMNQGSGDTSSFSPELLAMFGSMFEGDG